MTASLLETRDLIKTFGGVAAIDRVNFALAEGELRCLIGPNGAGKSTFFKILSGQLRPLSGRVLYRGRDITGAEPHAIARMGIGIKTQVPSVFEGLEVRENLRLAARRGRNKAAAASRVEALMERLGLQDLARRPVGHLAHGQRQWVELGLVLANDPDLVLLDEPTAGMTQDEVARTAELILEINRERAIIVVEHDMQFIRMIADRATVLHRGAIFVEDTKDRIMADPRVRDIYLGKAAGAGSGGEAADHA